MLGKLNRSEIHRIELAATGSQQHAAANSSASSPRLRPAAAPPTRSCRWLLVGLSLCAAVGGVAAAAFVWLMMIPPAPNCQQISPISPDRDRLYCAQSAAAAGELPQLLAGLDLLERWTPEHPLYQESQQWMTSWSESVLTIARQKISQSDLSSAVKIASQIPPMSPAYPDAQAAIVSWQHQWQQGRAIDTAVRNALHAQDWDRAMQQIATLRTLKYDHWRIQRANALTQQIQAEKRARQIFVQAQQTARAGNPAQLSAAITLVSQMNPKTYAWSDAQPSFNQWGTDLLKHGLQQWQSKNLSGAIATARRVALNPHLSQEAHRLLALSQARQLAVSSATNWEPSPKQVFNLMEAVSAVQTIPPDSRFYAQAQASLKSWQVYLQDLQQLQLAQLTASLGHHTALKAAIDQAQQIGSDRPRRVQAQTLIAHWQQQIQQIEDRPVLQRAQQLAVSGTIASLQTAIVQANQVAVDRALRIEAQGFVYGWQQRIQTLEDQPVLNQARTLARQGDLRGAMRVAAQIQPDRALYPQARSAIGGWRSEIRAAARAQARQREQAIVPVIRSTSTVEEDRQPEFRTNRRAPEPTPSIPATPSPIETTLREEPQLAPQSPSQSPLQSPPRSMVGDRAPIAPPPNAPAPAATPAAAVLAPGPAPAAPPITPLAIEKVPASTSKAF